MRKINSIVVIQDEEDQLLQQANEMLIEYGNHRALHAADDELFDVDEVALGQ